MDFPSKKARVRAQVYSSRLEGKDASLSTLAAPLQSVDDRLLALVKALKNDDSSTVDFPQAVADHLEQIGYDLREAYLLIGKRDSMGLDAIAQKLTQNALKVGAVKILSSAIEIQGLARIGDFCAAEQLLGTLEIELLSVRSELS